MRTLYAVAVLLNLITVEQVVMGKQDLKATSIQGTKNVANLINDDNNITGLGTVSTPKTENLKTRTNVKMLK